METNEIIFELKREFAQKQRRAEETAKRNFEFALTDNEFAKLNSDEKSLILEIAKLKAEGSDFSLKEKELENIYSKKENELFKIGLSSYDLKPHFECEICQDTGFVGKKACSCFNKALYGKLIQASGFNKQSLHSFGEFDENVCGSEEHKLALKKLKVVLKEWIDKFPNNKKKTLLISGPTGVGKTFALECFSNGMLSAGVSTYFLSAFAFNNILLKYHTATAINRQGILDILLDPEVLVIDDLGTEPVLKNVTLQYLYIIISERTESGKTTLMSTNLNLPDLLSRYGERIFSRLTSKATGMTLQIQGEDLRRKKL